MKVLKQSTASTLLLGPFVDDTDGKTAETALTISQADVLLWKEGGTTLAQKNEATSCTHRSNGLYTCPINATDTNTLGILTVSVHEAGALPVRHDYQVVPANVYDSFVLGSDTLDVQVTGMGANTLTATAIAADAITAAKVAADVTTEIQSGLATAAALATVDTVVDAILVDTDKIGTPVLHSGTAQAGASTSITLAAGASATNNLYNLDGIRLVSGTGAGQSRQIVDYDGATKVATVNEAWAVNPDNTSGYEVFSNGLDAATLTDIEGTVWDAQRSAHQQAGSFGERVLADMTHISGDSSAADNLEAMVDGTGLTLTNVLLPWNAAWDAEVQSECADALGTGSTLTAIPWNAAWDVEVQSEVADALAVYDPPTNAEMEARTLAAGSYATAANLATANANLVLVLADTAELQGDWANGGRLDLILDARASQITADAIEADTQNIQSRLPAALVNGYMSASIQAGLGVAWQQGGVGNKNIGPAV